MLPFSEKCGIVYDGHRCPACSARIDRIQEAGHLYMGGLCGGFFGMVFVFVRYPPLQAPSLDLFLIPILIAIPVATIILLQVCDQKERFATLAGLMLILAGAVLPSRAVFFFLNGALDKNPPVEVKGVVSNGFMYPGRHDVSYVLEAGVPWNQRQIQVHLTVNRDAYSFAETGDSLRLAIYPGAFHKPWYGQAVLSNGHREIRFKPR